MLQRTDEWFEVRRGKFTASDISRLLGKEGLKMTNQSIDNYAFEKAIENVFGIEQNDFISMDMQRGISLEPLAFDRFKEIKDFQFIGVENAGFYEFGKNAGASPDGIVSDNSVLEIKCPRRNKFFKLVANGQEEIDAGYYAQMQMQMLCTDAEKAYFFNYYIENSLEYWHELIILRDEEMINLIKQRIEIATEIKLNYINKINTNQQW